MTQQIQKARCHCGAVELELSLPHGISDARRCNCSLCRRKGAVMAYIPAADLKVSRGEDKLSLYQFHTNSAEHYFCSFCGIYTHHRTRIDPDLFGFNVGCLDVDPGFDPSSVTTNDGANHPMDQTND